MARGSWTRRLLVAGVVVWFATRAVSEHGLEPLAIEATPEEPPAPPPAARGTRTVRRRVATSLAFATLFFAGAAFTAGAGNEFASQVEGDSTASTDAAQADAAPTDATTTDAVTTATDAATTDPTSTTDAEATDPTPEPTPAAAPVESPTLAPTPDPAPDAAPASDAAPAADPAPPAAVEAAPVADVTPATEPDAVPPVAEATTAPATEAVAVASPAPTAKRLAATPHRAHAKKHATRHVAAQAKPLSLPIPFQAIAFDPQAWLHNNPASPMGASAVAIAEHYLGVPYRWGGAVPATGFDCSGLTRFVYAQLGIQMTHYAAAQFASFPKLDPAQLQPGDLVFFEPKLDGPGHVGLYIGNDQMIEAPHTGALVRISSLSGAAAALGFLGAVRPYAPGAAAVATRWTLSVRAAQPEPHPAGSPFYAI